VRAPLPSRAHPLAAIRVLTSPMCPRRYAWNATVDIHLTFAYAVSTNSINEGKM
jgi:hypothetical protein